MDYIGIVKKSWQIVKRNKALWVFGTVLAAMSGGSSFNSGGSSSSHSSGSSNFNWDKLFQQFQPKNNTPSSSSKEISQVLGAATTSLMKTVGDFFASIPVTFWIALILGLLLIIIFSVILNIFLRNWAKGALLKSANEAFQERGASLSQGSDFGRKTWLRLFLSNLIICLGFTLGLIILIVLTLIPLLIPGFGMIITVILGIMEALVFVPVIVFFIIWGLFSELLITIEDQTLKLALHNSFSLAKRFFFKAIIMGLINMGIGCLSGCLMLIVMGIILVIGGIGIAFIKSIGLVFIVPAAILFLIVIIGMTLVSGIIQALTTTNWVLFYQELKKENNL